MREFLFLFLAAFFLIVLQVGAAPLLAIGGVVPNFPLAAVFLWARRGWNRDFLIFAFFCALILEIFSGETGGVVVFSFFFWSLILGFLFETIFGKVKGFWLLLSALAAIFAFDFFRYASVIFFGFFGAEEAFSVGFTDFFAFTITGAFYNLIIILAAFYLFNGRRSTLSVSGD